MAIPIRVELYTPTFQQIGTIGDPKFVTLIPRHNRGGSGTFAVRANHRRIVECTTEGTRVKFIDRNEKTLFSGPIGGFRSSGPEKASLIEFNVRDDFDDIFQSILGWVVPGSAITAQGTAGTNWDSGLLPAETVVKNAVKANAVDRLGLPLTIPTSQGRGTPVRVKLRFNPLFDRIFPTVEGAGIEKDPTGIGFRVVQVGAGLELQTYMPRSIPQELTEKSGVVRSWSYSYDHRSVTRVVVGGEGEAQLRLFRERILPASEATLGRKLEAYRDARDTNDPNEMYLRADETLAEGSRKAGLAVELSETKHFKYRSPMDPESPGVAEGDQTTIKMGGVSITDRLQEVTLSFTADGGFITRPRVGDRADDPDRVIASKIKNIIRSIRMRNSEV